MDYREIGARMQALRRSRGMTQEQLAERANITPVYMSQIETGVKRASLPVLLRITEALDTHVEYLLTGNTPCGIDKLAELMSGCSEREWQIRLVIRDRKTIPAVDRFHFS